MQEQSTGAPRRRGEMTRVRWGIVGMAFLGTTINYVDRANLAVAAPFISDELKLGSFQLGLVLSGFFWTYAVGQLLAGYLVDRFGARSCTPSRQSGGPFSRRRPLSRRASPRSWASGCSWG